MLREIFTQSDEEALGSLMFDVRYKYALHTTSFKEQPVSKNSLSNFRVAVCKYNEEHGVDLIQEEIESHAKEFSKLLNIDGRMIRMDSLMISSSCKKLSRIEIVYSCIERLIKKISDINKEMLPEKYNIYLKEEHHNDVIYRSNDNALDERLNTLIEEAVELYNIFKSTDISKTEEFEILSRMLGEQSSEVDGEIVVTPSKEISPVSLQNPTDPDATYRRKGPKGYTGYVGNVVESFDDDNAIITQYDLQKNVYSDQQFSRDIIEKIGKQEKKIKVMIDGAYYSKEISDLAAAYNIELIPTSLVGKTQSEEKGCYAGFNIDEETLEVINCPAGIKPEKNSSKDGVCRAHFNKEICDSCPHKANCPLIEQSKKYLFSVSEKKLHRSRLLERMDEKEYIELANKRAGIEGIPSVLRRRYDIDNLPVRGLLRVKMYMGFKISAINCKRLIKLMGKKQKNPSIHTIFVSLLEVLSFQRSSLYNFARI